MRKDRHIALVNGVYPPDGGASGRVANDLVRHLVENGYKVSVISTQCDYKKTDEPIPHYGKVRRIKVLNWKNPKLLRLLGALWNSYKLIKEARRVDPDYYVVCTDPPFLHLISTVLLKNKKWALWTMDLYPEAFVANGLVGENNWLVKRFKTSLIKSPPNGIITLGQNQSTFLKTQYQLDCELNVILPCGVLEIPDERRRTPIWKIDDQKIYFGYTGNIGEAHSADFLINIVRSSNPTRHQFVFSLFGAKAERIKRELKDQSHVEFFSWIPAEEMPAIDIQIVTLAHEWTHVCVPSKAVSAICMGAPIIYHGREDGDIIAQYPKAIWHLPNDRKVLEQFYHRLTKESIKEKQRYIKSYAAQIHLDQKMGYSQIVNFFINE